MPSARWMKWHRKWLRVQDAVGSFLAVAWAILVIASVPMGFVYGAVNYGFVGAIGCALAALLVATILPAIVMLAAVMGLLYLLFLFVRLVASWFG
jgi:hypothetical protein